MKPCLRVKLALFPRPTDGLAGQLSLGSYYITDFNCVDARQCKPAPRDIDDPCKAVRRGTHLVPKLKFGSRGGTSKTSIEYVYLAQGLNPVAQRVLE